MGSNGMFFVTTAQKKAPPARLMRNLAGRAMELDITHYPCGAGLLAKTVCQQPICS